MVNDIRQRRAFPVVQVLLVWLLLLAALVGACRSPSPPPRRVLLDADGERRWVTTQAETVADLLDEVGVRLGELDRVEPPSYTLLEEGMTVRVVRVQERLVQEERPIPFERQVRRDPALPVGETRVARLGQTGRERLTWRVRYENGEETGRELVSREELTPAEPEIVVLGTAGSVETVPISGTIAYLASGNAWVMNGANAPRPLTRTGDLDGHVFTLSPDGKWLLFTRKPIGGSAGQAGPLNSLWIVRADVVDDEPRYLEVDSVLWADWRPCIPTPERPCFTDIGYSTAERSPAEPGWKALNDFWLITLSDRGDPVAPRQVLPPSGSEWYAWWGREWAWSPDGLYVAWGSATAVGFANVETGETGVLTTFYPYETNGPWAWTPRPAWRPDEEWLATVVHAPPVAGEAPERSEQFDLWLLPVAVSAPPVRLAANVGMWALPVWSPAGQLAYAQAEDPAGSATSRYAIVVADADGSNRRTLFPPDTRPGVERPFVEWSPDGRQVLLLWQGDLYLAGLDGTLKPLTAVGNILRFDWK